MRPASPAHQACLERRSPEYSGGAVPDSHRSSLFASRQQQRSTGHQSHVEEYNGRGETVKPAGGARHDPQGLPPRCLPLANNDGYGCRARQGLRVVRGRASPPEPAVRTALFR